jgi:hypothetical protein
MDEHIRLVFSVHRLTKVVGCLCTFFALLTKLVAIFYGQMTAKIPLSWWIIGIQEEHLHAGKT